MENFNGILTDLLSDRPEQGLQKLQETSLTEPSTAILSSIRLAVQCHGQSALYYQKLYNLWSNWGRPPLKPNVIRRRVVLLTDFTANGLVPLLSIYLASFGIDAKIQVPEFDSVEQVALNNAGYDTVIDDNTIVVLLLSEHWLSRYLGGSSIVTNEGLERVKKIYTSILNGLLAQKPNHILLATFPGRAYPYPAGLTEYGKTLGWELARLKTNLWLSCLVSTSVHLIDIENALFIAGGRSIVGQMSYFRAKMAYEPEGSVSVTREIAFAIANICGKSHRIIVTDWDNTLWGGEVAEDGNFGIVCGVDSPDGLIYYRIQEFLKNLKTTGILLAAVSRNDPKVQSVFEENTEVPLSLDDFSSLQIGWDSKSSSIEKVSKELGIGSEFMIFIDDSIFELAEAVRAHPYLDVLRARPDPEKTLSSLSQSRFCNVIALSDTDLNRTKAAKILRTQRETQNQYASLDDFLEKIDITLVASSLNENNIARVIQMFQKSNQFNLTTRRHGEQDLRGMLSDVSIIGVFSYNDTFGPQGIISTVILLHKAEYVLIESWIMSCRVLNRTVENAVFSWIIEQVGSKKLIGEFIPTQKNSLVKNLYKKFGFKLIRTDRQTGAEYWQYLSLKNKSLPDHFAKIRTLKNDCIKGKDV